MSTTMKNRLLAILVVLNLLDLLFSLNYIVYNNYASEGNPLLADIIHQNSILFAFSKLALVSGGVYILHKHNTSKLSMIAAVGCCLLYTAVVWKYFSFALSGIVA